jgi:hypothetical protein
MIWSIVDYFRSLQEIFHSYGNLAADLQLSIKFLETDSIHLSQNIWERAASLQLMEMSPLLMKDYVTFRPLPGAQGLWLEGISECRATPAVTQDLGFSSLIRRTFLFCRLLKHP